ncbi:MAG: hypothetical protein HYW65_04740 [Candidatus Liptonbacteria bacterium]|nr:hypothetical protein [Candidatus Liptonbacteria bacterium]
MPRAVRNIDVRIIKALRRAALPLARGALFIVYFWFGTLKLFGASPANPLIGELLDRAMPFLSFDTFIIGFAIYEMLIGVFFLAPGFERVATALLVPHLCVTALPLVFLPSLTWAGLFVPTLEGQYIVKNLVIIALAFGLAAQLRPVSSKKSPRAAAKLRKNEVSVSLRGIRPLAQNK